MDTCKFNANVGQNIPPELSHTIHTHWDGVAAVR